MKNKQTNKQNTITIYSSFKQIQAKTIEKIKELFYVSGILSYPYSILTHSKENQIMK